MAGKLFKITQDTEFATDPPHHEKTYAYPLVNPKTCPGAQVEFHVTEIQKGGAANDDIHPEEDHVFYVLSGRAEAKVGDEVVLLGTQQEEEITAMMLAKWANTVTYDILSRWSTRMDRVYIPS